MKIWLVSGMGEHFKHVLLTKEYKLKVSSFLFLELLFFWPSIRRNEVWTYLEPHDHQTTLIYIISMEFLSLPHRRPSWQNIPNGEEQGETAVFAG